MDDLPCSVSVLLREHLRISPQISVVDSNQSVPSPSKCRSPRREVPNETDEPSASVEPPEGVLYDCVKCAMEVVRLNNDVMSPRDEDDEAESWDEEAEAHAEEREIREERPSSACSLR